jgi:antibiotic biosynthesis monooxygenase (ABM) superfamily enzyme
MKKITTIGFDVFYLTFERKAPGYLGTTIIIPGGSKSPLRYIIRRFVYKAVMERWDNSEESLRLLKEANDYSTRHYDTSTGLETWFTFPDLKTLSQSPPPRWKMAIVIFFAAYAISSLSRSKSFSRTVANTWKCCSLYCNTSYFTYLFCTPYYESFDATLVISRKCIITA